MLAPLCLGVLLSFAWHLSTELSHCFLPLKRRTAFCSCTSAQSSLSHPFHFGICLNSRHFDVLLTSVTNKAKIRLTMKKQFGQGPVSQISRSAKNPWVSSAQSCDKAQKSKVSHSNRLCWRWISACKHGAWYTVKLFVLLAVDNILRSCPAKQSTNTQPVWFRTKCLIWEKLGSHLGFHHSEDKVQHIVLTGEVSLWPSTLLPYTYSAMLLSKVCHVKSFGGTSDGSPRPSKHYCRGKHSLRWGCGFSLCLAFGQEKKISIAK